MKSGDFNHSYVSLPEGKKQILPFTTYTVTGHEGWMVGSAKVMGPQVIQIVIRGPF